MSKIFLSYRFTGEDPKQLDEVLGTIRKKLIASGHDIFCSFFMEDYFRKKAMTSDEIYDYCLERQAESDTFLVFVKSEHKSTGMQKESEKAVQLGQKYVLLIRNDLDFFYLRSLAHTTIEYKDMPDLYQRLDTIDFAT